MLLLNSKLCSLHVTRDPPYTLYPYGLEFLHRFPIKRGLMQIMMHYFINHENTRSILLVTVF